MDWRRWLARLGRVVFAVGLLILLFVAYQLWGTGISTRLHQEELRRQFNGELATARHERQTPTTTAVASGVPTTTAPERGVAPPVPGDVPANGQPVGTIDIPTIGANYVVVEGTTTSDLQLGPGHYAGTALPGQPGNAAIAGHRTTYLAPFFNLNELSAGDPIYITTTQGRFHYDVTSIEVVSPSDLAVLDSTPTPTLTLTTCNPRYSAAQRLVVLAALVSPPAPVPVVHHVAPSPPVSGRSPAGASTVSRTLAGESSSAWPALAWGTGTAALVVGIWLIARRCSRRLSRIAVYAIGAPPLLVILFFFFQNVSPLLPASF